MGQAGASGSLDPEGEAEIGVGVLVCRVAGRAARIGAGTRRAGLRAAGRPPGCLGRAPATGPLLVASTSALTSGA